MPGLARRTGAPKISMVATPRGGGLGSAAGGGEQRFALTRSFTRPNIEDFTGSLRGMSGGWAYSLQTVKAGFFDRGAVMNRLNDIQAKVYSKFGAYVRTAAKTSIRPSNSISKPGMPPKSHVGLLKQHIYFAWDFITRSVVIGPLLFRTAAQANLSIQGANGYTTVPSVLEYGGVVTRRKERKTGAYKPRPFMGPAFRSVYEQDLGRFWQEVRQTPFTP